MPETEITFTREEFYNAIWKTPACHVCKAWNITMAAFVNICEKFDIPRPGPDYWPLLKLNRPLERTPLTPATADMPSLINISLAAKKKQAPQPRIQPEKVSVPDASKAHSSSSTQNSPSLIVVAQDFKKAHPLIRTSKAFLESHTPDKYNRIGPRKWKEKCVNISVTKSQLKRALLIMDAVLRELGTKGHKPDFEENRGEYEFGIRVGEEFARIKMTESTVRRERPLSPEEKASSFVWNRYIFEPTGILTFCIDEYWGPPHKSWSDTSRLKIESLIHEIVDATIATGEALRVQKIKRQEEERRAAEQRQREFELQQLWEKERKRREEFLRQAELWDKTDRLRSFLACCEACLANRDELGTESPARRWLDWARRYADEIDPLKGDYLKNAIRAHPEDLVRVVTPPVAKDNI